MRFLVAPLLRKANRCKSLKVKHFRGFSFSKKRQNTPYFGIVEWCEEWDILKLSKYPTKTGSIALIVSILLS